MLSFVPLRVYLYREGFARFTNARYSMAREDLSNSLVHLTNHAVQKKDEGYDASQTDLKWPIRNLKLHMLSKHGPDATAECFSKIQDIIIGSLRAVCPIMINDKHCIELYGRAAPAAAPHPRRLGLPCQQAQWRRVAAAGMTS